MSKIIITCMMFFFFLLSVNSISAQAKTVYKGSLVSLIKGKKLNDGQTLIHTTESKNQIFAVKDANGVVTYIFKRPDGSIIPDTEQSTVERGKRKCWKCIEESNGDVNCFEQACPKSVVTSPRATN